MERRPDIGELPVDLLGAVGGELTSPRPGRLELDSKLLKDIPAPVITGSTTIPQVPLAPLGGHHMAYGYNLPTYGIGPTGAYTAPVVATSHPALHSYHHISSMGADVNTVYVFTDVRDWFSIVDLNFDGSYSCPNYDSIQEPAFKLQMRQLIGSYKRAR